MSAERKLIHTEYIPIRWGDMDAMGHVNNTIYFRYMEQARISWFGTLGEQPGPDGVGPIIINAACRFRKELTYPGTVEVRTYAGKPGNSSVPTFIEMRMQDDPGTLYADGSAVIVWIDYPKRKAVRVPDRVRALLPK